MVFRKIIVVVSSIVFDAIFVITIVLRRQAFFYVASISLISICSITVFWFLSLVIGFLLFCFCSVFCVAFVFELLVGVSSSSWSWLTAKLRLFECSLIGVSFLLLSMQQQQQNILKKMFLFAFLSFWSSSPHRSIWNNCERNFVPEKKYKKKFAM